MGNESSKNNNLYGGKYSKYVVISHGIYSGFDTSQLGYDGARNYLSNPENESHIGTRLPSNVSLIFHGSKCLDKTSVEHLVSKICIQETEEFPDAIKLQPRSFFPNLTLKFTSLSDNPPSGIYECRNGAAGQAQVQKNHSTTTKELFSFLSSLGEAKKEFVSVHLLCCSQHIPGEIMEYTKHKLQPVSAGKSELPKFINQTPIHKGGTYAGSGGGSPTFAGGSLASQTLSQYQGENTRGLLVSVKKMGRGYEARYSNGLVVDFGSNEKTFADYYAQNETLANQMKIKFLKKHKTNNDAFSPETLTKYILWNKPTLKESIYDYNSMFY
jgi:hypothetical protein